MALPRRQCASNFLLWELVANTSRRQDAAFRSDAVLYQDFLVRCRIRRYGEPLPLPGFRRRLAVARARVNQSAAEGEAWTMAHDAVGRLAG